MSAIVLVLKSVYDELRDLFVKDGLGQALSWLFRGSPLILRLTTLFFLVLSVVLATVVSMNIAKTDAIVIKTLSSPIEATPHPNSAIEALLLSSILVEPEHGGLISPNRNGVPLPRASDTFKQDVAQLEKVLGAGPTDSAVDIKAEAIQPVEPLDSREDSQGHLSHSILSDEKNGFLFVPGITLPATEDQDVTTFLKNEKSLLSKLAEN
jgi:hypothetical protein